MPKRGPTTIIASERQPSVDFAVLFADELGPINRSTFDAWHATWSGRCWSANRSDGGLATKISNIYLETRAFDAQGRHHLKERCRDRCGGR